MSEVKWIKITTSMFDNEKIKLIRKMPEADSILLTWVQLLVQAGKSNASGSIVLNEKIAYSDEMLAVIFDRPIQIIRLALQTFVQFGMIDIEDGVISITNWEEHQNIDGLDKIREKEKLRKQRQREKQKQLSTGQSRDSHGTVPQNVTQCHAIELDKELDKEKDLVVVVEKPNPFVFWESNGFGTISSYLTENINYWIDGNYFDEPEEVVILAMKEAVLSNANSWKYIESILTYWEKAKLRTVKDIEAQMAAYKAKKEKGGANNAIFGGRSPSYTTKDSGEPKEIFVPNHTGWKRPQRNV